MYDVEEVDNMNEYDKQVFANNLNRLMEQNNKKQADLRKLLNVSKSTVSSWCNAQKIPRMDKIETLAIYFNVKKSDLIEDKNNKPTNNDRLNEFIELCSHLSDDELDIIETLIDSLLSKHGKED